MANKERGEIGAKVDGKDYTLRPTFDAVCELETLIGKSFDVVMADIADGKLSGLRATVWCLLQECHGDEIKTLKDASEWIERAGGTERVFSLLNGALEANTEPDVEGQTANPPSAQDGTGERLSLAHATSA